MSKPKARFVTPRPDDRWAVKAPGAKRASFVCDTQKEAIRIAREALRKRQGGELVVLGEDGKIRDKDTVPPGNDPCPPRDGKR